MAGENPNYDNLPYNLQQLSEVTEDTGGGVYALRTTGGGGGGGDATAANQVTQIGLETDINNNIIALQTITDTVASNTGNTATAVQAMQPDIAATAASTDAINTNTSNANNYLNNIDAQTAGTNSILSTISAAIATINTNIAQLKGSLIPCSKLRWNTGTAAAIGAAHQVIGFYDVTSKAWLNPYNLSAGAQALLTADEYFCCLQNPTGANLLNYTNNVSKGNRTFAAIDAPALIDVDIYYTSAH